MFFKRGVGVGWGLTLICIIRSSFVCEATSPQSFLWPRESAPAPGCYPVRDALQSLSLKVGRYLCEV